jgi:hypothetical protein
MRDALGIVPTDIGVYVLAGVRPAPQSTTACDSGSGSSGSSAIPETAAQDALRDSVASPTTVQQSTELKTAVPEQVRNQS